MWGWPERGKEENFGGERKMLNVNKEPIEHVRGINQKVQIRDGVGCV